MEKRSQDKTLPGYLFLAEMTPGTSPRDVFEQTYEDHLAQLSAVPGVRAATRAWAHDGAVVIGGKAKDLSGPDDHHVAAYAIDHPEVLTSAEWRAAVDAGPWATTTRGQTGERQHRILRVSSWWSGGRPLE